MNSQLESSPLTSSALTPRPDFKQQLSETLYWIRGIAIVLVVMGHVIGFDRNYGMREHYHSPLSWLGWFGDGINTIHMPTFLIASGLATDLLSRGGGSFRSFFMQKVPRLLLPLICWAPPFFIFQSLVKHHPIDIGSVWAAIVEPYEIFWFLHALIFAVIFRFLCHKLLPSKGTYFGIATMLMVGSFFPPLNSFVVYLYWNFFFALGVILSKFLPKLHEWLQRQAQWVLILLMLVCFIIIIETKLMLPLTSQLLIVRLCTGMPGFVLLYLACGLSKRMTDRLALSIIHAKLSYLGMMSMVIYLFHGYFTRLSSLIITQFGGQIPPIGYFVILSSAGIVAPLLLNALILKRNPILAYITGGK